MASHLPCGLLLSLETDAAGSFVSIFYARKYWCRWSYRYLGPISDTDHHAHLRDISRRAVEPTSNIASAALLACAGSDHP
jgi:hypothetical protein